jgi:hypothetical protein
MKNTAESAIEGSIGTLIPIIATNASNRAIIERKLFI